MADTISVATSNANINGLQTIKKENNMTKTLTQKSNFDFSFTNTPAQAVYCNTEAHNELMAMMNRQERLNAFFTVDQFGCEAVRVESKKTAAFNYQLNQKSFELFVNYLRNGNAEDFGINPQKVNAAVAADGYEFRKYLLFSFIENKVAPLQFTPEFRDRSGILTAVAHFKFGNLMFYVRRDEETVEYLRDKGFIR